LQKSHSEFLHLVVLVALLLLHRGIEIATKFELLGLSVSVSFVVVVFVVLGGLWRRDEDLEMMRDCSAGAL
jgi:hypothetical protein